jgi:nitroreductase
MPTPYELRYRRQDCAQPDVRSNEFIERHLARKSVRHYDPLRKIAQKQLDYLFACAQAAPSSSGAGSWSAVVLTTAEEKERFRIASGPVLHGPDIHNTQAFLDCSAFIIWLADNYKIQRGIELVAQGKPSMASLALLNTRLKPGAESAKPDWSNLNNLFDAKTHTDLLDQSYYGFRAVHDATIAAQTFIMCAESLGMNTLYMGSIAHCNISSFKQELNLPDRTFPIFGTCIGYEHPDGSDHNGLPRHIEAIERFKKHPDWNIKPVMPQRAVVHYGQYCPEVLDDALLEYNETLTDYFKIVEPVRPSDYLVARVTGRVKQAVNHIEQMKSMGNKML